MEISNVGLLSAINSLFFELMGTFMFWQYAKALEMNDISCHASFVWQVVSIWWIRMLLCPFNVEYLNNAIFF